jgi:hypothetical protein
MVSTKAQPVQNNSILKMEEVLQNFRRSRTHLQRTWPLPIIIRSTNSQVGRNWYLRFLVVLHHHMTLPAVSDILFIQHLLPKEVGRLEFCFCLSFHWLPLGESIGADPTDLWTCTISIGRNQWVVTAPWRWRQPDFLNISNIAWFCAWYRQEKQPTLWIQLDKFALSSPRQYYLINKYGTT